VACQERRQRVVRVSELDGDDVAAGLLRRLEPLCHPDALVRVKVEGVVSRDRYHVLDLAGARDFGAARCALFDLHADGLVLADDEWAPLDARATDGRVAPRDALAACADELIGAATDAAERDLLLATRAAVLAAYDEC
jgi:hypothetical protein